MQNTIQLVTFCMMTGIRDAKLVTALDATTRADSNQMLEDGIYGGGGGGGGGGT